MGLGQGHWFTCPNGHPYFIGECGGAMQTGKIQILRQMRNSISLTEAFIFYNTFSTMSTMW